MEPQDVLEGGAPMTLTYWYQRGPASSSEWYFNGLQIRNNSRYSITQKSLTVSGPRRGDAGNYSVVLKNPLSTSNQSTKVSVLCKCPDGAGYIFIYGEIHSKEALNPTLHTLNCFSCLVFRLHLCSLDGPDRPVLKVSPSQASFTSGENLSLSCGAAGEPVPIVSWVHQGRTLPSSSDGTLHLTNVQTSQSGTYTCVLSNSKTKAQHDGNVTIIVWGELPDIMQCYQHWRTQMFLPGLKTQSSLYFNSGVVILQSMCCVVCVQVLAARPLWPYPPESRVESFFFSSSSASSISATTAAKRKVHRNIETYAWSFITTLFPVNTGFYIDRSEPQVSRR